MISIDNTPVTWRSVALRVRRCGHWWELPSQESAASVETDACRAVGWQRWAGTSEELEEKQKKLSLDNFFFYLNGFVVVIMYNIFQYLSRWVLTFLPYGWLGWRVIKQRRGHTGAAPCAVLLSVRAHNESYDIVDLEKKWLLSVWFMTIIIIYSELDPTLTFLEFLNWIWMNDHLMRLARRSEISHIRFWAVQLSQRRRSEQPLPLAEGRRATLTGSHVVTGQRLGADSQLPGRIRSVCGWESWTSLASSLSRYVLLWMRWITLSHHS